MGGGARRDERRRRDPHGADALIRSPHQRPGAPPVPRDVSHFDVAAGTARSRRRLVASFTVSDLSFAGGRRLPRHAHPQSCIAVVLAGGVTKTYRHVTHEAQRATVIAMPAEELHEDAFASAGARLVVVESGEGAAQPGAFEDWGAVSIAHRVAEELEPAGPVHRSGARGTRARADDPRAPSRAARDHGECRWLDAAAELLRERYRDPPTAAELAHEVGVHPAHLARRFRARFGESVGSTRATRGSTGRPRGFAPTLPLARIACEAGFADQSHFTRAFARRFGVAPAATARARRSRASLRQTAPHRSRRRVACFLRWLLLQEGSNRMRKLFAVVVIALGSRASPARHRPRGGTRLEPSRGAQRVRAADARAAELHVRRRRGARRGRGRRLPLPGSRRRHTVHRRRTRDLHGRARERRLGRRGDRPLERPDGHRSGRLVACDRQRQPSRRPADIRTFLGMGTIA